MILILWKAFHDPGFNRKYYYLHFKINNMWLRIDYNEHRLTEKGWYSWSDNSVIAALPALEGVETL